MPMSPDEYAQENGFTDTKSMREYIDEFGTIELPPHEDTVVLSQSKYQYFLWLTTPKPFTHDMQHIDCILIKRDGDYVIGCINEFIWCDEFVSWLPLPNTPMPTP